jgi:hypothetical protein
MTSALHIRRRYIVLIAVAFVAVAGTLLLVQAAGSSATYSVTVPEDLSPTLRLAPDDVAAMVLQRLGDGATIDRVTALATRASVPLVEPRAPKPGPGLKPSGPVWVVRAKGDFRSTGRFGSTPIVADSGYYVIRDSDGIILGMGMP